MKSENQKNYTPILLTALLVMAGIAGYLAFDRSQIIKSLGETQQVVNEQEIMQKDLQLSFDDVTEKLDQMKTDNVELNALIEEQKAELSKQKDRISSLISVDKKWKQAKSEIAALEANGAKFLAEIQALKEENAQLSNANVSLTEERNVLTQKVVRTEEENTELSAKKVELENYSKELAKERDYLNKKVDVASVIKVYDIVAQGYKVDSKGNLDERKYAKFVDRMSVCFTTEKNLVTENEEEEFYLRIIDPLGETMAIEDLGSGVLVKSSDGKSVRYTNSGVVDYKNDARKVCLDWQPNIRWAKGKYLVEIYNKGYKVGDSSINLK